MTLPVQTFNQFVSGMGSSWAASTGQAPVFSSGDVLLALFQAVALQCDFLQALVQQVNALTRAQTSTGADLDSWMAQFGFARLPATFADGQVTFGKNVPATTAINIPAGTIVQTQDGTIQYQVVADLNQTAWNPSLNAYVLLPGRISLTATAQATISGTGSNVIANTLIQMGSSVPGIDTVTNPSPITNGLTAESDSAFRARFVQYLATLAQATKSAITAAVNGVQQGLLVALAENQIPSGTSQVGSFTAFIDDGSGNPPTALLNSVYNALWNARAFSVQPFVAPPIILNTTVSVTVRLAATAALGTVTLAIQNAIAALTQTLPAGSTLFVSAVEAATLAVAGVVSVKPGTLLNALNQDVVPGTFQEVRATAANVSVSTY